jgi:hypothetical protein
MLIYYHPTLVYYRQKYFKITETEKEAIYNDCDDDFLEYMHKIEDHTRSYKTKRPVLYFLLEELPQAVETFFDTLRDIRITIKNHFYPYNIVKCRYLSVNYHDKDLVMEHCILELLAQFVEREKPWEFESSSREIAKQYEEDLYDGEKRSVIWAKLKKAYYFYKHLEEIESFLDEKKLKHIYREAVMNTVTYREYLWT